VEAENGEDAWALLLQDSFDVVLTDWMMPKMAGPELCRRIRERPNAPYVYLVMCTALSDREHGLNGMHAGADIFLTKPIDRISLDMCLIAAERVIAMQRTVASQNAELERLNRLLADSARTDPLTGLGNRLRLREDLEKLAALAARYDLSFAAAMCDVDQFKGYNDRFGHMAGDDVLRTVAGILEQHCRMSDDVYRFGGEELLVLFPHRAQETMRVAAERLRQAVEAAAIDHPDNHPYGIVTISIGVASLQEVTPRTPEALLQRADQALYRAKRSGRNRVEMFIEAETSAARSS
jgi:two-component system chemotaxis response regulator CheY